jgi:hypothetical protein
MHPWTHGKVFCKPAQVIYFRQFTNAISVSFPVKFSLPKASSTIIILSQLDSRFFKFIDGVASMSNIDFVVYKRGDKYIKGESYSGIFCERSVSCELDLDEGEYIVYVSPIFFFHYSLATDYNVCSLGLI